MKTHRDSGFALLLVFLMAAMIAITLYMQLPRVAFESQRAKEQLLVERGEQYKRAIQLFVRKMNRYPGRIEELENTNSIRFLRHKYKDPMTGKEEWRLIHYNGGVFTDSIKNKGKKGEQKDENRNTFIAELQSIGAQPTTPQGASSVAMRRRPSDMPGAPGQAGAIPGMPGQFPASLAEASMAAQPVTGIPGMPGQPLPGQPGYPQQITGMTGATAPPGMQAPLPGQPFPGTQVQPYPGTQPQPYPGTQPYPVTLAQPYPEMPGQTGQPSGFPGMPGIPGVPGQVQSPQPFIGGQAWPPSNTPSRMYPGQPGAGPQYPYATSPGAMGMQPPPFGQPGTQAGGPQPGQNEAVKMIQSILTSPRPGGFPGAAVGGMGAQIGGGIAGVASTLEQDSIMIYDEQQKYNEWEFLYDMSKDRTNAGRMMGQQVGTRPEDLGGRSQSSPGQSGFGQSSFGQPGFGSGQSGFGQPGFGSQPPRTPGPRD
ncbi:MAG: hypothetical protein ACE15B_20480 [Bryobacteraceae bacterium]